MVLALPPPTHLTVAAAAALDPSAGSPARSVPPQPRTVAVTFLPTWSQEEMKLSRASTLRLVFAPMGSDQSAAEWVFEMNLWASREERARPATRYHPDKTEENIRPGHRALLYFSGKWSDKYRFCVTDRTVFPDVYQYTTFRVAIFAESRGFVMCSHCGRIASYSESTARTQVPR